VKQHVKNVVLVHGAFADGSGWKRVADILKNDGYKVSVAQPPETSYADDQKYTKAAIDAMGGPVVLVGHSYGGPLSPRPAIIQTSRRLSILPRLLSMKVRVVRRSNRPCHKRQRRSRRTATGSGRSTRRISWPTSQRTFHGMKLSSWL
jgi:hypothetical protein